MTTKAPLAFPVRGVPGGWRDWYDEPDDSAELRAELEERGRQLAASVARTRRRLVLQL